MVRALVKRFVYFIRAQNFTRDFVAGSRIMPEATGSVVIPAAAPGGIGDDAMVNGSIIALNELYADEPVSILVPKQFPSDFRFSPGHEHLMLFSKWSHPANEAAELVGYKRTYVLGADILDGVYNLPDAIKRIRLAGVCSEQGQDSRIIGFSLNENPHPAVIQEFKRLNGVPLFLRDPLSYERAQRLIGGDVRLSADTAFLLQPMVGDCSAAVEHFASQARATGNRVYGLNIHDLLSRFSSDRTLDKLVTSIANLISSRKDCSFVLIPHDYRRMVDDRVPLRRIHETLDQEARSRVHLLFDPMRAAEIKQVCTSLDGVLTGRMHLAIAALGVGVPVMGIVYQGKFEGTLSYFDLDKEFTLTPEQAADYEFLVRKFDFWVKSADLISKNIVESLPGVKKLAANNFQEG